MQGFQIYTDKNLKAIDILVLIIEIELFEIQTYKFINRNHFLSLDAQNF